MNCWPVLGTSAPLKRSFGALDDFLKLSGRDILTHAGKISHDKALKKAHVEYNQYLKERLNEPSLVEQQFLEAVREMKQIEKKRKRGHRDGS